MAKAKTLVAACDITVDGVPYARGDELRGVPAGSLDAMQRMGQAVEAAEPKPKPKPETKPKAEPKPKPKPKAAEPKAAE